MRKLLLVCLFLLLLGSVGSLSLNIIATKVMDRFIGWVVEEAASQGVEVERPRVGQTTFHFPNVVRVKQVHASLMIRQNGFDDARYDLEIEGLQFVLSKDLDAYVLIKGMTLSLRDDASQWPLHLRSFDQIEIEKLSLDSKVYLLKPQEAKQQVNPMLSRLIALLRDGYTDSSEMSVEGRVAFGLLDKQLGFDLLLDERDQGYAFAISEKDRRAIMREFSEELTPLEQQVMFAEPVRLPALLRIREQVKQKAEEAHRQNYSVPMQAYRHILWSYWLAKTFDSDYALEILQAYDAGSDHDREVRLMNEQNNQVGVTYNEEGVEEGQILDRMIEDTSVVMVAA